MYYFVTRHAGAVDWANHQVGAEFHVISHFNTAGVKPGDVVAGTLPVQLAAEVCRLGGRYFHLTLDLPPEARGIELTPADMERFGARLEEFVIVPKADFDVMTRISMF